MAMVLTPVVSTLSAPPTLLPTLTIQLSHHYLAVISEIFDISNNLLRSALASDGEILTSVWSGRPKWYFHQMGTGNPIGLSTLMSQNIWNGFYRVYPDALYGAGMVHPSFHGDVSLKLFPYETVPELVITQDSCSNRFILSWDRHTDSDVFEYVVQRTESLDSSFLDLAISTTDTFYIDSFPNAGMNYYMVRGIKPIENCSGIHYELSHGIIDSAEYREPIAYAGNDTAVCEAMEVTLGTSFAYDTFIELNWAPGNILTDSTLQQPTWTVTQDQDFILSAIDTITGCIDLDTISITENPLPLDTINPPSIFNTCGDTISIDASHSPTGKSYHWIFTAGSPATAGGVGSHVVDWTLSGAYTIYLSVYNQTTLCLKQDSLIYNVACVLPVQLIQAKAVYQTNCNQINTKWVTTAEYNLQGYYLELYKDQKLISKTFVPAKYAHSSQINTYSINAQVEQEVNRFLLTNLDNNGTITVLADQPIASQNCFRDIELYPNPIKINDHAELTIRNIRGVDEIIMYDASGAQVLKTDLTGQTETKIKSVQTLKAGIYFVQLGDRRFKLVVY